MHILQVVALASRENIYGGPTTVAINQCRALKEQGHAVTLAAGRFKDSTPQIPELDTRLFLAHNIVPRLGFAGLTSLGLLRWIGRNAAAYDVIHVHMARDLITLPAAMLSLRRGVPTFLQTHGMIDQTDKKLARPLDILATLPTLRRASGIFFLTPYEERELHTITKSAIKTIQLINGVPSAQEVLNSTAIREVLYVARLQERKRPRVFVAAALELAQRHPGVKFTLIGPDEGEGEAVTEMLSTHDSGSRVAWLGPMTPQATVERLSRAAVYVLPSSNEPYPMTVLEAMSLGVPVIVTDTCGLADHVVAADAGVVVSSDVNELVSALDKLLSNEALRAAMGSRGRRLARSTFVMSNVAETLTRSYRREAVAEAR